MEEEENIIFFTVLLLGNADVGKTSFLSRYFEQKFSLQTLGTIGFDSKVKNIDKNNKKIKLRIYDTAGHERYRSIAKNYYKGADGIILMYDVSDIYSYNGIKTWIQSIKDNIDFDKIGLVVVENKCDLPDEEKQITDEMREKLEEDIGLEVIIASAKDDINVNESFDLLVDKMLALVEKNEDSLKYSIKIEKNPNNIDNQKKGNCCSSKNKEI